MSEESRSLKDVHARVTQLFMPLVALTKINPSSPEALDLLDTALKKLPPGESFGQVLDETRHELAQAVEHTRTERSQAFGRIEADFIRGARERGVTTRETSNGWRIGALALEVRRAQAQARALYNREVLIDWKPVRSVEDLEKLEQAAEKQLTRAELPTDLLTAVYWDAYAQLRDRRTKGGKLRPESVTLLDHYGEVRSTLVRYELDGQRPDRKLKYAEFPRWAYLYNLDRLRARGLDVPSERRLSVATGSQQEATKLGLSVNGLDADDDYKTMCYVQGQSGTGA